jgi:predicted dehydrogenase
MTIAAADEIPDSAGMGDKAAIALVGAGVIGSQHAVAIAATARARLACVVDPTEAGSLLAAKFDVPWFASIDPMLNARIADGVYIATPNQLHVEGGLASIEAGLPVLVEKPLSTDLAGARLLVSRAASAGVALATGHHRRHNPLVAKAKALIEHGELGQIATVHGTTWFMKPDSYFGVEWRRRKGAGPVYLNLIHDIDLLMHFCGPVAEVQAQESSAIRGNEVEDTAVILLRFENGALGTVNVCDTAVAPWSWEMTARENPAYPATPEACYMIAGTKASLSLPNLALWSNPGKPGWWEPISATRVPYAFADPLVRQADQFATVILDGAAPLVSGEDGLAALAVIEAVKSAAARGAKVKPTL